MRYIAIVILLCCITCLAGAQATTPPADPAKAKPAAQEPAKPKDSAAKTTAPAPAGNPEKKQDAPADANGQGKPTATAPPAAKGLPTLYVPPTGDGFDVYITAALAKKGVPVTILEKPENATYTLRPAPIEVHKESTGAKITRCVFLNCAGIEDKASVSVQLVKDGAVQWSYSVNKGRGEKNRQSMAEAIAKHLKAEYFKQ